MARRGSRNRDEYDSPWKEVLERYFPAFMEFFFPVAYADIDWSRGYEFLDKELAKVIREAKSGNRHADKLVKVWRKSGEDAWVLAHVEVQGQATDDFPQRMYIYNYRIFDRYVRPVASLAVLADPVPDWRPHHFGYEIWGCSPGLIFPVVKLNDYGDRWEELEASPNPFAPVVMAHLKAQETGPYPQQRLEWKFRIVRGLYERGFARQDVLEIFRIIDWMMSLPEDLDAAFHVSLQQYEEQQSMPYITSIERIATKRGLEQGLEQGGQRELRDSIRRAVHIRFGEVPGETLDEITRASDLETLRELLDEVIRCNSLNGLLAYARSH